MPARCSSAVGLWVRDLRESRSGGRLPLPPPSLSGLPLVLSLSLRPLGIKPNFIALRSIVSFTCGRLFDINESDDLMAVGSYYLHVYFL